MRTTLTAIKPYLSVLLLITLVVIAFSIILYKKLPSGADAFVYVHEALWIQDNDQATVPYQKTYAGARAYVSPISALNLFLLSDASGEPINYPVTSFYQVLLISVVATSLAAMAYTTRSLRIVLLTLLSLLGNYGLYRLNIATTISNILAFALINSIFLTFWMMRKSVDLIHIILLVGQLVALLLLHRYLTAPFVFLTLLTYGISLLLFSKVHRTRLRNFLYKHNWAALLGVLLVVVLSFIFYNAFQSPIQELLISNIIFTSAGDSFHLTSYIQHIGQPLFLFGLIGFILFPLMFRQYWPQFGLVWCFTLLLLLLPLLKLVDIGFYFDRTTIITIPYLALFSGIMLHQLLNWMDIISQRFSLIVLICIVTIVGIAQNFDIYRQSNFVTERYIAAYEFLATVSTPTEIILTNRNEMSDTKHDAIISHRNILPAYISRTYSDNYITDTNNIEQKVFQTPTNHKNIEILKEAGIRYVVIVRHNQPNTAEVNFILRQYRKSNYFKKIYRNDYVEIFQLV